MWPRAVEVMFAVWLALSPFIFGHPDEAAAQWATDLGCATVIAVVSLASFSRRFCRLHLVNIAVGLWLVGFGALRYTHPVPPAGQNNVAVGILLMMFAIIPPDANAPPPSWRDAQNQGRGRPP